MPSYTLYFLDPADGQMLRRYIFDAKDDLAAVQFAATWAEHAPMELWRGVEKVQQWDLHDETAGH